MTVLLNNKQISFIFFLIDVHFDMRFEKYHLLTIWFFKHFLFNIFN